VFDERWHSGVTEVLREVHRPADRYQTVACSARRAGACGHNPAGARSNRTLDNLSGEIAQDPDRLTGFYRLAGEDGALPEAVRGR
jgi:hypothetical protein